MSDKRFDVNKQPSVGVSQSQQSSTGVCSLILPLESSGSMLNFQFILDPNYLERPISIPTVS